MTGTRLNHHIASLIAKGTPPDPTGNVLYSFTGGKDKNEDVRCDHGWDAINRMSKKVWGCAGYVKFEKPGLQRDGIACGFYLRAHEVDKTPFRLNARAYNEFDWGTEAPSQALLDARSLYRQGKSTVDNSADILQSIFDASCASRSLSPPVSPASGRVPITPGRSSSRAAVLSSPYLSSHLSHRGPDKKDERSEPSHVELVTPMHPNRLFSGAPRGYPQASSNFATLDPGPSTRDPNLNVGPSDALPAPLSRKDAKDDDLSGEAHQEKSNGKGKEKAPS